MSELIETYPEMKERHRREMIALVMRFNDTMTVNQAATAIGMSKDKLRKFAYDNGISFLRATKLERLITRRNHVTSMREK